MVIEAHAEIGEQFPYSSASVNTSKDKYWQYGRFEMRAKLPQGQGIWPAFWTLGNVQTENPNDAWPGCGEIDIMEMVGGTAGDSRLYGTIHWERDGAAIQNSGNFTLDQGKLADDFHIYAMEWTADSIEWFFDGNKYHSVDISEDQYCAFRRPHYVLLNLAVGGNWPGFPDQSTTFPQSYLIDYVKVFQQ